MSDEKITEIEKNLAIQEDRMTRVLKAVEKQALSSHELNLSVTTMTARLGSHVQETKDLRGEVKSLSGEINAIKTDIAVIKRGNTWQPWAERAIITALMAGILWAATQFKG